MGRGECRQPDPAEESLFRRDDGRPLAGKTGDAVLGHAEIIGEQVARRLANPVPQVALLIVGRIEHADDLAVAVLHRVLCTMGRARSVLVSYESRSVRSREYGARL